MYNITSALAKRFSKFHFLSEDGKENMSPNHRLMIQ